MLLRCWQELWLLSPLLSPGQLLPGGGGQGQHHHQARAGWGAAGGLAADRVSPCWLLTAATDCWWSCGASCPQVSLLTVDCCCWSCGASCPQVSLLAADDDDVGLNVHRCWADAWQTLLHMMMMWDLMLSDVRLTHDRHCYTWWWCGT